MSENTPTPAASILDEILANPQPAAGVGRLFRGTAPSTGMTLEGTVDRLRDTAKRKLDVVMGTRDHVRLTMAEDATIRATFTATGTPLDGADIQVNQWAHRQIAARSEIPWAYYERMLDQEPDLLLLNVHRWWDKAPETRMARTLVPNGTPGLLRAWVSDRFRVMDNFDLTLATLEAAAPFGAKLHTCNVDDQRLYIQLVTPIRGDIKRSDAISLGVTVRNSEVGDGKISVSPWVLREICSNGATSKLNFSQVHLGERQNLGVLSQETIDAQTDAVWSEVKDWVRFALDPSQLDRILALYRGVQQVPITQKAKVVVANVARRYNLTAPEAENVLERYLRENDDTAFGVVNAITREAQERSDYRRRMDFEVFGGDLLETKPSTLDDILNTPLSDATVERAFAVR